MKLLLVSIFSCTLRAFICFILHGIFRHFRTLRGLCFESFNTDAFCALRTDFFFVYLPAYMNMNVFDFAERAWFKGFRSKFSVPVGNSRVLVGCAERI